MSSPFLSVVTVVYKNADGLRRTIDSLRPLEGLQVSWEHIVVDSSPSLHDSALKALPASWPLQHIQQPPEGIYPAMNVGIRSATGSVIWFLHGGDELRDPAALTQALDHFQSDPSLEILCCGVELIEDDQRLYFLSGNPRLEKNLLGTNRLCQQGLLYRRSLFERIGNFSTEYQLASDYEHHFRCWLHGASFKVFPRHLTRYHVEGASTQWEKSIEEFQKIGAIYSRQMPVMMSFFHQMSGAYERHRVRWVKTTTRTWIGRKIRTIWHRLKSA